MGCTKSVRPGEGVGIGFSSLGVHFLIFEMDGGNLFS